MAKFIGECVGLLLAFVFIAWLVWPLLKKMMVAQEESIRLSISSADEARDAAATELIAAKDRLEAARDDATSILEQARRTADQLRAEGVARGEDEYERLLESAAAEAEFERQRAREEVMREIGVIVMAATERVVTAELDVGRQRGLIGEAIDAAEAMA